MQLSYLTDLVTSRRKHAEDPGRGLWESNKHDQEGATVAMLFAHRDFFLLFLCSHAFLKPMWYDKKG